MLLAGALLYALTAIAPLEAAADDAIPVELTTFVTAAMDAVVGITFRLDGEEAAAGCTYWLLYGTESDPALFLGTELRLGANAQALGEMGHLDENGTATIQTPWLGYAEVYFFQAVIARSDHALYQGDTWATDVLAIRTDGEVWTEWASAVSPAILARSDEMETPASDADEDAAPPATSSVCQTLTVMQDGTGDFTSIQDAVDAAAEGAVIVIAPGMYSESIELRSGVTLRGAGPDSTTLQYSGLGWGVEAEGLSGAVIEGLSIDGPTTVNVADSSLTIADCKFLPSSKLGIYVTSVSTLSLVRCEISGRTSGGVFARDSTITVQDCHIHSSNGGDGVRLLDSTAVIERCQISGNAYWGVVAEGSDVTLRWSAITGNNYSGLRMEHCEIEVAGSLIATNGRHGIQLLEASSGILIGNTIVGNESCGLTGSGYVLPHDVFEANRLVMSGNIIALNQYHGISVDYLADHASGYVTLQGNNVWENGLGYGEDYSGIQPGASDFSVDPEFINPQEGDLRLKPTSPCLEELGWETAVLQEWSAMSPIGDSYYDYNFIPLSAEPGSEETALPEDVPEEPTPGEDDTAPEGSPETPDGEPIEGGPGNDPLPEPWPPRKPIILTLFPGNANETACGEAIAEALTQSTGAEITWQPASSVEELIDCFASQDSLVFSFLDAEAYVTLQQEQDGNLMPRLVESRYGLPYTYSSVYAYRDRAINSWDDLAGLMWCYPYQESTLGYWLPNLVFEQLGIVSGGTLEAGSHADSMVSLVEHRCDFCTAYGFPPTPPQGNDDIWQWGDYVERWIWDPRAGQLVPKSERGTCTDVRSLLLDTYGEEWLLQNVGVVANIGPLPNRSLVFAVGFPGDAADRIVQESREQIGTGEGRSLWECLGVYEFVPASESEFKCLREFADPSRTVETVSSSCACFPKPVPESVAREGVVGSAPEEACAYLRMAWLGAEDESIESVDRQLHLPLVVILSSTCDDAMDVTSLVVTDQEGQIMEVIWQSEETPIRVGVGEETHWYWKSPGLLPEGDYNLLATSSVGELELRFRVVEPTS